MKFDAWKTYLTLITLRRRSEICISLLAEVHWLDNFPGCQDPYPYHWQNVRCYADAIGCLGQQLQPEVTFGWMHNVASFVAIAKLLHHLPGVTAGSILGPLTDHFALNQRVATAYERVLFGFACRYLKKMITPSQGVRLDLISHFFAPPSRVTTIYNGVDLRRVAHLAKEHPDQPFPVKRGFWVLAASRLSREKGLDVMLTGFARVCAEKASTLILLGEGPERTLLVQLIQQLGLADRAS